jgi:hypothetical protein
VSGTCGPTSSIWLATGLSAPDAIVTDAATVYWTDLGTGTVNAVAKSGGTVVSLATGQAKPVGIAVDDAYVYWSSNLGGAVSRTQKGGGDTVHTVASATTPTDIAVDSVYLYYLDSSGVIQRVPKDGSSLPAPFATPPGPMALPFSAMVSDGTTLYALAPSGTGIGEEVWQIDLATGDVTESAVGEVHSARAMAVGPTLFAVSSLEGPVGAIEWIDEATGYGSTLITSPYTASALAIAACGFVWTESQGLYLWGPPGSAFAAPLFSAASPNQIVGDGGVVFWTDASGAIGRIVVQ